MDRAAFSVQFFKELHIEIPSVDIKVLSAVRPEGGHNVRQRFGTITDGVLCKFDFLRFL